jgi:hypothetical protein
MLVGLLLSRQHPDPDYGNNNEKDIAGARWCGTGPIPIGQHHRKDNHIICQNRCSISHKISLHRSGPAPFSTFLFKSLLTR